MVELRVLGTCDVVGANGQSVDALTRQPKRLALLVFLAVARPRGFQRRDKLLSLFWPELDERRARNALSQALHVLRTTLDEGAIVSRGEEEIAVAPEVVRCDAVDFERALDAQQLESALRLYRGDLLDGFNVSGAPDFERWLDAERVWIRQRSCDAGWSLARQKREAGDLLGAAREARAAAKRLSPDETQARRLISFLYELGDRAAAIQTYEEFARELAVEYELEPSAETQRLAATIRSESPPRYRSAAAISPRNGPADESSISFVRRSRSRRWLAGVAVFIVLAGAMTLFLRRPAGSVRPVVRFSLSLGGRAPLAAGIIGSTIALSPDGRRLIYVGVGDRNTGLFMRSMDGLAVTPIPHTEGAHLPFFSPSGDGLGFVLGNAIETMKLPDGVPVRVCVFSGEAGGATWAPSNVIVFATPAGLWRVPAAGGTPQLFSPNDDPKRRLYDWPTALPTGKAVVVTMVDSSGFQLASASLETGVVIPLGVEGTDPHFVEPGFLVFARPDGVLRAAPFDPRRLKLTGAAQPIAEGVVAGIAGAVKLGVSRDGALAFIPEPASKTLVIVDRAGRARPLQLPAQYLFNARFSPDGRRIAISTAMVGGQADIWVFDQLTKGRWPVTFDSSSVTPVWTPDGRRIVVATKLGRRLAGWAIRAVPMDASDTAQLLLASGPGQLPYAITPDGKALFFRRFDKRRHSQVWVLPLEGNAPPYPYIREPFNVRAPAVSPDGRWVAYVSDESGKDEVYVRSFPNPGRAILISASGGREPRWSTSGQEILYRTDSQMVAAHVRAASPLRITSRRILFDDRPYESWADGAEYDIHPDGEHFVMIRHEPVRHDVIVILNWFDQERMARR